jgi:hypothetical protein
MPILMEKELEQELTQHFKPIYDQLKAKFPEIYHRCTTKALEMYTSRGTSQPSDSTCTTASSSGSFHVSRDIQTPSRSEAGSAADRFAISDPVRLSSTRAGQLPQNQKLITGFATDHSNSDFPQDQPLVRATENAQQQTLIENAPEEFRPLSQGTGSDIAMLQEPRLIEKPNLNQFDRVQHSHPWSLSHVATSSETPWSPERATGECELPGPANFPFELEGTAPAATAAPVSPDTGNAQQDLADLDLEQAAY